MIIERGPIIDLLERDGESLVLTEQRCLRLSAVPTAILSMLDSSRSQEEIERYVEATFGPPPPGRLQEVLDELAAADLIIVHP